MTEQDSLMVSRIETLLGRPLSELEVNDVVIWERGKALSQVHSDVWEIVFASIKNYVDDAAADLVKLQPGSPLVKEHHAVAYGMADFFIKFQRDIQDTIGFSMQTPEVLREAARKSSPIPPESLG